MSITTFAELQTAVTNWQGRGDLASRITEGIALAEAKINRKLRTKDMETKNAAFALAAATEYIAVPTGFGGVRQFYLNTTPRQVVELMPGDLFTLTYQDAATGKPANYDIEGSNFRLGPIPDAAYTATLIYFLQVPALSVSATTNWLLTSHPDAYLYLTNAEMAAFAKDFPTAQAWEAMGYKVLAEIVGISNRDKWSGGTLTARPG
jgi:hypothetical protein